MQPSEQLGTEPMSPPWGYSNKMINGAGHALQEIPKQMMRARYLVTDNVTIRIQILFLFL